MVAAAVSIREAWRHVLKLRGIWLIATMPLLKNLPPRQAIFIIVCTSCTSWTTLCPHKSTRDASGLLLTKSKILEALPRVLDLFYDPSKAFPSSCVAIRW